MSIMPNMDLLRELVKQRLSDAADEVFNLFLKSIEEYQELVQSQNRALLQTAEIRVDSAERQKSQEQQGISYPLPIKQEQAEPKQLWSHVEEQQLQEVEVFTSTAVHINNVVNDIQLESSENHAFQEQNRYSPSLEQKLPFPLQIKQEPVEPKEVWNHQEDQQVQEVDVFPSSSVKMDSNQEGDIFLPTMKVGPAAYPVPLDRAHVKPYEQQQWSSIVKKEVITQEHKGPEEESTKSLFPALTSEDSQAKDSLPPRRESNQISHEEPMETDEEDDGGGLEAAQQSASEKTANSSDCDTEDSDDEWEKNKEKLSKVVNVIAPKPANEQSSDESKKTNPTQPEVKTDIKSEPVTSSAPTRDSGSEDMTSDSSDAESKDSNQQQQQQWKNTAMETKQLPDAAASPKHHSRKKYSRKSSERQSTRQPTPCPQCGKEFLYRSNLHRHVRSHCGSKKTKRKDKINFSCSVCGKIFKQQVHLDFHLRLHKVQTQINMEICSQDRVGDSGGAS